jgi:hypothetical protein
MAGFAHCLHGQVRRSQLASGPRATLAGLELAVRARLATEGRSRTKARCVGASPARAGPELVPDIAVKERHGGRRQKK